MAQQKTLTRPIVYRKQNPDGSHNYFMEPMPIIRKGNGKRDLIIGASAHVGSRGDVRLVTNPEVIAKLSALWDTYQEAEKALSQEAFKGFETAEEFTEEEITQTSEFVNAAMKIQL